MSSARVVQATMDYLTSEFPSVKKVDMSGSFQELKDMLAEAPTAITMEEDWIGLTFIGNDETPRTIPATGVKGKYRETGVIMIHVVSVAKSGLGMLASTQSAIRTRAEALRDKFRGRRIGNTYKVFAVTPPNFAKGATLDFDGGHISATIMISYESDLDL